MVFDDSLVHYIMAVCRCKIDWKKGKNLTVKTIKKKQKNKGTVWSLVALMADINSSLCTLQGRVKLRS